MDNLIEELCEIHRRCKKLIDERDHKGLIEISNYIINETDNEAKLNKLKTILIISKNVPSFMLEITDTRERVLDEYYRLGLQYV